MFQIILFIPSSELFLHPLLQFFIDGYETASQQISLAYYFLAINPHVQEKAFNEVKALAEKMDIDLSADKFNIVGDAINELR